MPVKNSSITKPAPEGRRATRTDVSARARLREAGMNPFDVDLFDLSSTGFRFFSYSPPAVDTHLWVNLPGLQLLITQVQTLTAFANAEGTQVERRNQPFDFQPVLEVQTEARIVVTKNRIGMIVDDRVGISAQCGRSGSSGVQSGAGYGSGSCKWFDGGKDHVRASDAAATAAL